MLTADCERKNSYPWTYYYVKDEAFRLGRKGYMFNEEKEADGTKPFTRTVLAETCKSSGASPRTPRRAFVSFVRAAADVGMPRVAR